ncbi:hypothetical protein DL93DRAFT_2124375 [Clavulina sp. PMI_390]|nr:hypothetical protein DL93DRAFT_2124375 [Clavulina sp. PMI_390]
MTSSYTRRAATGITALITLGTVYSVIHDTALDTSDPLNHFANRHGTQTSYLAKKSNVFNVYFVKYAWGWTTAAAAALAFTAPGAIRQPLRRLSRWAATTLVWAAFASWFFGPSLFARLNLLSGAQCLVKLPPSNVDPSSSASDTWITVPSEYCYASTSITPSSHPSFFANNPDIAKAFAGTASIAGSGVVQTLQLRPRLLRGHDVSGHLFLLTLSILFLVDQLTPSLAYLGLAVGSTVALVALWTVMAVTTSVYFHTPLEKFSGWVAGILGYLASSVTSQTVESVLGA